MKRCSAGSIYLSDHAFQRWQLRVDDRAKKKRVSTDIRHRLETELRLGAEVSKNGSLEIEVKPEVWAICYPSFMGGWVVATIIREGWKEDMEERAKYDGRSGAKHDTGQAPSYIGAAWNHPVYCSGQGIRGAKIWER